MTNKELTEIREGLNLTKTDLAKKLSITPMLLGKYEKGTAAIPEEIINMVEELTASTKPAEEPEEAATPEESVDEEEPVTEPETESAPEKAEKRATAKKTANTAPVIFIQSQMGGSITPEDVMAKLPADVETVYIKPEENKAYWVKGDESGSVELW